MANPVFVVDPCSQEEEIDPLDFVLFQVNVTNVTKDSTEALPFKFYKPGGDVISPETIDLLQSSLSQYNEAFFKFKEFIRNKEAKKVNIF